MCKVDVMTIDCIVSSGQSDREVNHRFPKSRNEGQCGWLRQSPSWLFSTEHLDNQKNEQTGGVCVELRKADY